MTKADISSYQQLLQWFDHVLQKFPNISIKETIVKWVTYIQEKIWALLRLKLFTKKPKNAADAKEAVNDMIQQMSTKAPWFHLIFEDIIKRLNDYLRQFPWLSKFIQNIKNKIQSYPSLEQTISLQGWFEDDTTYEVEQWFNFTKITDTLQWLKKESWQFQITFNNQYKYLNPWEQYTYYIDNWNDQKMIHIHYTTQNKVLLTYNKDITTINKRNTWYIDKQILWHNTYEYAHASDTMIDNQTTKWYAYNTKWLKAWHNENNVFINIKDWKIKITIINDISTK